MTETDQRVCVILSVERAYGYDENEMLVFLNVFKHTKTITCAAKI
jgi:hypothetical protein